MYEILSQGTKDEISLFVLFGAGVIAVIVLAAMIVYDLIKGNPIVEEEEEETW